MKSKTELGRRYKRAREMSGLSLKQAAKMIDRLLLPRLLEHWETSSEHNSVPPDGIIRMMADMYGCSLGYLQGESVPIPEWLTRAYRQDQISHNDYVVVAEFMQSLTAKVQK